MSLHEISNNSTLWVVGAFLLVTLAVGLYAGRGIKTFKEYAIGNKKFGAAALALTLLATNIGGGSTFGDSEEIFNNGIIVVIALIACSIDYLFTAIFIAPKIVLFKKALTIGDLFEELYGKKAKVISGII